MREHHSESFDGSYAEKRHIARLRKHDLIVGLPDRRREGFGNEFLTLWIACDHIDLYNVLLPALIILLGAFVWPTLADLQPLFAIDGPVVLHYGHMSHTITVRLTPDLAEWLETTARKTGVPQGRIIRQQLERARTAADKPFLRLAGAIDGPRDLSRRKGFAKK